MNTRVKNYFELLLFNQQKHNILLLLTQKKFGLNYPLTQLLYRWLKNNVHNDLPKSKN